MRSHKVQYLSHASLYPTETHDACQVGVHVSRDLLMCVIKHIDCRYVCDISKQTRNVDVLSINRDFSIFGEVILF